MRTRKNTLVLFSKLPEVGKVKTRLTVLKDGIFQPEVASALYHCMLFDVVEIIMAAMDDLETRSRVAVQAGEANVLDTYERVGGNMYLDGPLKSEGGHTVFGQVFEGMDVLDAIAAVKTDENDKPLEDVIIESIEWTTYQG